MLARAFTLHNSCFYSPLLLFFLKALSLSLSLSLSFSPISLHSPSLANILLQCHINRHIMGNKGSKAKAGVKDAIKKVKGENTNDEKKQTESERNAKSNEEEEKINDNSSERSFTSQDISHILRVRVERGENLQKTEIIGASDAFCLVSLGSTSVRTKIVQSQ